MSLPSERRVFSADFAIPKTVPVKVRLHYLDWLRIIAYTWLVLYHAALIFSGWNYRIQNDTSSDLFRVPMQFINPWRMPLLFLVSGIGTWFALGKRNANDFLKDRIRRLFIPLIFGVVLLVPPIVYFQQMARPGFESSYVQFSLNYFSHFRILRWSHLWFIAYLFFFVLLTTPLFLYMRTGQGAGLTQRAATFFTSGRLRLIGLVIPLFLIEWLLSDLWSGKRNLIRDWYHVAFYGTVFIYGYFIAAANVLWGTVERERRIYLFFGLLSFAVLYASWHLNGQTDKERPHSGHILIDLVWSLNVLSWMLCSLGYARRYLNFSRPILQYSNRATLPCYLLHLPILIGIAYYVVRLDIGVFEKYAIVVIGTFAMTIAIYEFIVRRVKLLHIVFGVVEK